MEFINVNIFKSFLLFGVQGYASTYNYQKSFTFMHKITE